MQNLSDVDIRNTLFFLQSSQVTGDQAETFVALNMKYRLILEELAKPEGERDLGPDVDPPGKKASAGKKSPPAKKSAVKKSAAKPRGPRKT